MWVISVCIMYAYVNVCLSSLQVAGVCRALLPGRTPRAGGGGVHQPCGLGRGTALRGLAAPAQDSKPGSAP